MRQVVCTKVTEAGIPEAAMLDIMGHMSAKMLRRYSHIRQAAKIEATQAVEERSAFRVKPAKASAKVGENPEAKTPVTH